MRDYRSQKKAKNIIQGRRDADGKVVKKKKNVVQILNRTGSGLRSYSLDMALSTNHSWPLTKQTRTEPVDSTEKTENEKSILVKSRRNKNWFHPHIWPAIDMAVKHTNYSLRETVKYLQSHHQADDCYDALSFTTISNEID